MKYLNRFAVVLVALALAIPAVVLAKGPSGDHGKSGQPHGKANPNHVNKHCKHQSMVGYTYGGTLASNSTASNLVINVTHATLTYLSMDNHDPDGGSNGSSRTLSRR